MIDDNAGPWRLQVFGLGSNPAVAACSDEHSGSVTIFGSIIYRRRAFAEALPGLLADFEPTSFAWEDLLGTYAAIVRKQGNVHLFTDGLGASRLYTNADRTIFSNSFLAMCELVRPRRLRVQACYEYVIAGSVYGDKTLVEEIDVLPANCLVAIDERGQVSLTQKRSPIDDTAPPVDMTLDAIADYHCERLDPVFAPLAENFPDRIRLSFSGGFDSRLMLAMLLRHDATPTLFVYGREDDEDVRIARHISSAEKLPLKWIDKSRAPSVAPDAFVDEAEKNLWAFDGWKVETPLFDFGTDREDRIRRHLDGQIPLNGSLGEIYRNFFYMPDRPSSTGALVDTFYSRYDPRSLTERFDPHRYRAAMGDAMRQAIGADTDRLSRSQVEALYPRFRGRFWTGRDAANNQRFGPMFFPYLEPAAIAHTATVPIRFKDLGYLQGRMIARINPRLAAYPSDYGFALDGPRPVGYRLKSFVGTQRPPWLRRRSFRWTHRSPQPLPDPLSDPYLSRVIDLEFPVMRALFHIDRIHCPTQYGLIATLEYLAQRYNLEPNER
jgi:asparagine synthase (glutamine-hydrolysing)